jgi:5-formyltetrahydrofolate cyclo-ligase
LAFAEQLVDSIPTTESDEPVDFVVTDEEVIRCKGRKGA